MKNQIIVCNQIPSELPNTVEVGDKHVEVQEYGGTVTVVDIWDNASKFALLYYDGGSSDPLTYEELKERCNELYFNPDEYPDASKTNERIDTDFGKRDCTVYTDEYGGEVEKIYVGAKSNVIYKHVRENGNETHTEELIKSSMFVESNDEFKLKDAKDLKVFDTYRYIHYYTYTTEITEVIPAEGDNPVMYNIGTETDPDIVSHGDLVRELELKVSGELMLKPFEYKGTETLETFLGNVTCDVYEATEYSPGSTEKVYVSNGVGVKAVVEYMDSYEYDSYYWSHSDFIVKK